MVDDYAQAAIRHYQDAESLARLDRLDNAGYLIGFAAECALKKKLRDIHADQTMTFTGHHPEPQRQLRMILEGRNMTGVWLNLARDRSFFAGWSVDGRYAPNGHVTKDQYKNWKAATERVLSEARLRWRPPLVKPAAAGEGE